MKETFDEACSAFTDFLRNSGQSFELQWICREDITGSRRKLFIHPSPPSINRELYRRYYEFGTRQKRGIRLDVLCFTSERACCYVWVPEDDIAAEQSWVSNDLCMSFHVASNDSSAGFLARQCSTVLEFKIRSLLCGLSGESRRIQEVPTSSEIRSH